MRINAPKQTRSRATLERISAAAVELIAEQGVEATTVAQIVARAGSSVGSFYARFSTKEDLLEYLRERVWLEATVRWDGAVATHSWKELGLEPLVHGVVRLLVQADSVYPAVRAALGEPEGTEESESFREHVMDDVKTMLMEHAPDLGHPNPELAIHLGLRMVRAAIVAFRTTKDSRIPAEDDELAHELALAYLGYLYGGTRPEGVLGDVEFFDIWG